MTRSTGDQRDDAGEAAAESVAREAVTWLPSRPDTSGWFDQTECFRVGGVEFHCSFESGSTVDRFFICKHRPLVEEHLDVFAGLTDANVVELGISEGGSTAMTALVADPKKLVAIELDESRIGALDELIERNGLTERVRPYYGVNQADRNRVRAIVEDEFGGEKLDLVIDDASHHLVETRASFETLFPRLRPGGLFMIEDWNQQRFSRTLAETLAAMPPDSPDRVDYEKGLSELVAPPPADGTGTRGAITPLGVDPHIIYLTFELVLAQADSMEFISEVSIGHHMISVRRGPGELDPDTFRLSELFADTLRVLPQSGGR